PPLVKAFKNPSADLSISPQSDAILASLPSVAESENGSRNNSRGTCETFSRPNIASVPAKNTDFPFAPSPSRNMHFCRLVSAVSKYPTNSCNRLIRSWSPSKFVCRKDDQAGQISP